MSLKTKIWSPILCAVLLSACADMNITGPDTFERPNDKDQKRDRDRANGTIFGKGGITFGGDDEPQRAGQGSGIGVNAFLWRASLDTISFMPLISADPFGGVILTDWFSESVSPNERFKLNVYILGQSLRSDGIRVAAFRQIKNARNEWQTVDVEPKVVLDIENAILTRARQLRSETNAQ